MIWEKVKLKARRLENCSSLRLWTEFSIYPDYPMFVVNGVKFPPLKKNDTRSHGNETGNINEPVNEKLTWNVVSLYRTNTFKNLLDQLTFYDLRLSVRWRDEREDFEQLVSEIGE